MLPLVTSEQELCADVRTPFINTTSTCLQLKYLQLGDNTEWKMDIYLRNEKLDMTLIKTLQYTSSVASGVLQRALDTWQMLFLKLPDRKGLQQVLVKITRPAGKASGLGIDDLTIRPCSDFG